MIHYISNQLSLVESNNSNIVTSTIDKLKEWAEDKKSIGFDLETTSLDFHEPILLAQFGDYENQFVVDCTTVSIKEFKDILESKLLLGHNLKFDLRFLYHNGIFPNRVIDTYVQECVINKGRLLPKGYRGLDKCCSRYLGVDLDKSVKSAIRREGNTERVIKYAAEDTQHLHNLNAKQKQIIFRENLEVSALLENEFVLSLAYTMFCGIKVDTIKWKERTDKYKKLMLEKQEVLNTYIPVESKFINKQINLFTNETSISINWASEKQVKDFFRTIGFEPKDKEGKSTIEEPVLNKFTKEFPIVVDFLEYQGYKKQVTTYGDEFLKNINKYSNRIHCEYHQIQDTGRLSSSKPNLQNIPSDKETRSCFISEEEWDFLIADYEGQEQVILANFCQDKNLIEFYKGGHSDMHSYIASKMYPELYDISLEDIKKHHKEKRQIAKSAGFAINYGGNGLTITDNTGISKEQGEQVYRYYMEAFPQLAVYFKKAKKMVLDYGYILINNYTKSKTYVDKYDYFKELNRQVQSGGFWTSYKSDDDFKTANKGLVREWAITKSGIERQALNYPIQGTGADVSKLAAIFLLRKLKEKNLLQYVKFINMVHDEIDLEVQIAYSTEVAILLKESMEEAGTRFCKIVPLKADVEISKYWKK